MGIKLFFVLGRIKQVDITKINVYKQGNTVKFAYGALLEMTGIPAWK